jgi:hypothetical protein
VIKGKARANRAVVLNSLPVTRDNVDAYQAQYIDTLPDYDARTLSRAVTPTSPDDALKIVLK